MPADTASDPAQASSSKSKKHKKKKSKAAPKVNGDIPHENGTTEATPEDDVDDEGPEASPKEEPSVDAPADVDITREPGSPDNAIESPNIEPEVAVSDLPRTSDTATRLEAAAKERDQLREEVTELRRSLEDIQRRHDEDVASTKSQLKEARTGHDQAETKYQKLRGQVNTIKTQLGERLKADAAELSSTRERVEELEGEARACKESNEALQSQVTKLTSQTEHQAHDIESLRSRTNLSQQNWAKERDDLVTQEMQAREEFEAVRQAMQDREVLAMEESSMREALDERISDLEEQLSSTREAYDKASSERESQNTTVDGLQRALREVHDARKEERRELVETSQAQLEDLRKQLTTADSARNEANENLEKTRAHLEKALPFEKEVREKNLFIGKLRHEAVILNDHLTKALRFLKRGKPEDNVDRQLVTNHFLHFLALDRSDPKKFQILQLISALLGWTDDQKESAGLARPGASTSTSLRIPLSTPFRRVSSSAALSPISNAFSSMNSPPSTAGSFDSGASPSHKEGLAELWSEFLSREAEEGSQGRAGGSVSSRRGSGASTPRIRAVMSPTAGPAMSSTGLKGMGGARRLDDVGEGSGSSGKAEDA